MAAADVVLQTLLPVREEVLVCGLLSLLTGLSLLRRKARRNQRVELEQVGWQVAEGRS